MTPAERSANKTSAAPRALSIAGLRTRLVSRLTGLSSPQLRHWHRSGLIAASLRPGDRGIPRLYSWTDYLRLQVAAEMSQDGVHTTRIRNVVAFLDRSLPAWDMLGDIIEADRQGHVLIRPPEQAHGFVASLEGQYFMELRAEVTADVVASAARALAAISTRGSLGHLYEFRGDVFMHPEVNLGRPTLVETSLETRFIAGVSSDLGEGETGAIYRIPRARVARAVSFESKVA